MKVTKLLKTAYSMYTSTVLLFAGLVLVATYGSVTYGLYLNFGIEFVMLFIVAITILGKLMSKIWFSIKAVIKCSNISEEVKEKLKESLTAEQKIAIVLDATTVRADWFIYICYILSSYLLVWWYVLYVLAILLVFKTPNIREIFPNRYVCGTKGSPTDVLLKSIGARKNTEAYCAKVMYSKGEISAELFSLMM